MSKSLEERLHALEQKDAMYGPITLGGPCRLCGRSNHSPLSCEDAEREQSEAMESLVKAAFGKLPNPLLEGG